MRYELSDYEWTAIKPTLPHAALEQEKISRGVLQRCSRGRWWRFEGELRAPDAAQRVSDALLVRGPCYLTTVWVPALRSSAKSAAPRPGNTHGHLKRFFALGHRC